MLVMLSQNISKGFASWKRVKEVLECTQELTEGNFSGESIQKGKIEFQNVSFSYPGRSTPILKNINLTIEAGETVAIMGATGCGKTTLVQLISRFYDTSEGTVLVDGVDVRAYQQKVLRNKIAFVLQKSELFRASIRENISWGNPSADDMEIRQVAEIAQASDFIEKMPDGYDTQIAEQGVSLSGGQKQRIAIARAVLKPAEILIFDDATSALDVKTEADLYAALEKTHSHCTKIMIAQRISSVRRANRILVIADGSICACGTHEELMQSSKVYRDIYDSQMGEGV